MKRAQIRVTKQVPFIGLQEREREREREIGQHCAFINDGCRGDHDSERKAAEEKNKDVVKDTSTSSKESAKEITKDDCQGDND